MIGMYFKIGALVVIIGLLAGVAWEITSTYNELADVKVLLIASDRDKLLAIAAAESKDAVISSLEREALVQIKLNNEYKNNVAEIIAEVQRLKLKRHDYEGLREGNQRELVLKIMNKAFKKTSLEITGNG